MLSPLGLSKELEKVTSLYIAVTSSGDGGAILGHSYYVFCNDETIYLKLEKCHAVEYNLDINVGSKFEETKKKGLWDKISAFQEAKFKVYIYDNALKFQQKYLDRDQSVTYYRYSGGTDKISEIYNIVIAEKHERDIFEHFDYDIVDNNCATKLVEKIEMVEGEENIFFREQDFYEIDQYLSNLPVSLKSSIEKSHLFRFGLEITKNKWRSFEIE